MENLEKQDLRFAIVRLPKILRTIMEDPTWSDRIFIGGGYIRALVSWEKVNDIDVFVRSKDDAELLSLKLADTKNSVYKTGNAYTIKNLKPVVQIVFRWLFDKPEDVVNSFDFTIACAVFFYRDKQWQGLVDERFYRDLAAKRLVYRCPSRNEDAGGSALRVLKYYQKGYRIPLDSFGAVLARLVMGCRIDEVENKPKEWDGFTTEQRYAFVLTGLLRVVDPQIDPFHEAHLPSIAQPLTEEDDLPF